MSKYIDAERLRAEIERYENTAIDAYNPLGEDADFWNGKVVACEDLKTLVTYLQQEQPEADVEKEYKTWWNSISGKINVEHIMEWYMHETARHFFELGLNARK